MKKLYLVLAVFLLAACNEGASDDKVKQVIQQIAEPETVVVPHNYSMKDGFEYGYEQGVSQDAANAGQVATTLIMFRFSGQKDGVYQVYSKTNEYVSTIIECATPCEFMKLMTYVKGSGVTATERMRAVPGSIGHSVLEDAMNGHLEQYVGEANGKKFNIWMTEKSPALTYLK